MTKAPWPPGHRQPGFCAWPCGHDCPLSEAWKTVKPDADACKNPTFSKIGGELQGVTGVSHAPHSPQRRAGCSAGCRRRACTCPHRDPCSLGQTTAALPTPAESGVCSEKETANVFLSSRVDFLEAYDVHSVNLNYSEISDSLYRFVPSAEFTVFPLKKKKKLFAPG